MACSIAILSAMFDGEAALEPHAKRRPLWSGDYERRLMHDETHVVLSSAAVRITP